MGGVWVGIWVVGYRFDGCDFFRWVGGFVPIGLMVGLGVWWVCLVVGLAFRFVVICLFIWVILVWIFCCDFVGVAGGIFCCDFGMDFWICCDLLVLILLGIGLLEVKASARG